MRKKKDAVFPNNSSRFLFIHDAQKGNAAG